MERKARKKFIASLLALWCLFGLGALILFWEMSQSNAADQSVPAGISTSSDSGSVSTDPGVSSADPVRLIIPSVGINANVQKVGLTANGNMGVPTGKNKWVDVGWYEYGPKPGEPGNAVIDGHVDNALTLQAVFYNLNQLNIGDEIDVVDMGGATHRFKVTDKQIYYYNQAPLEQIFGPTSGAHLNLITCFGGVYLPSIRSYDKRLVIYSELIQ